VTARILSVLLLAGSLSAPCAGTFDDLAATVGTAFDQESATFAEGAYDILLGVHGAIVEAMAADPAPEPCELSRFAALDVMVSYNLGCLEALAGRTEEAFTWLTLAVESGYADPEWMAQDPDLSSLAGDERFQSLVDAAGRNGLETTPVDCGGSCGEDGGCCGGNSCE